MTRKVLFAVLALVGICSVVGTAQAVVQAHQDEQYEISLPKFERHTYKTPATVLSANQAAESVRQQYGGEWAVYSWDAQTKTPAYIIGSGVQVAPTLAAGSDVESIAREVIWQNRQALGADIDNLRYLYERRGKGKVAAHFQQTYRGIDVFGGRVHTTSTEEGRVFVMSSRYHSGIDLAAQPSIPATVAEDIARQYLPYNPQTDSVSEPPELLILPVPTGPESVEHHLVWKMVVETADPMGYWITHVDAHDGEIVWVNNGIEFVDYSGQVDNDASHISYCNGDETVPAAYMDITVDAVGTATTDQNGDWTLTNGDTTPRDASAGFYGPWCGVYVDDDHGPESVLTETITPGTPWTPRFNTGNSQGDERDVWDQVQDLRDYFEWVDPGFHVSNNRQNCNVSIGENCNAFFSPGALTINFYTAGGGCANTGEIQSVVAHEYGHHVQQRMTGAPQDPFEEGIGEGNSDVMAGFITDEAIIGRGFYLNACSSGLRTIQNTRRYPDNFIEGQIYTNGLIIGGFHWDTLTYLKQIWGDETGLLKASEAWHYGRVLEEPVYLVDQVLATFIADDSDGDLDNGTPNYDAICQAAHNHGFDCPAVSEGVIILHDPLWSTEVEGSVEIYAEILAMATTTLDSTQTWYSIDGADYVKLDMDPTGNPSEFVATIPDLVYGNEVSYFIRGTDDEGNFATSPALAPVFTYEFDVALVYQPHELFAGAFQVNVEGTDDATQGIWIRTIPTGEANSPDEDTTPPNGTKCWITGQNQALAFGTTTLYSRTYDLTGASGLKVKYSKWYHNETGSFPGEDYWVVQVQNDGGPWVDVENTNVTTDEWEEFESEFGSLLGGPVGEVRFKFIASDLNNFTNIEAAVDEFRILGSYDVSDAPGPLPGDAPKFALFGSSPNPTRGDVTIGFQVPAAIDVAVTIYDVSGREVRTLLRDRIDAGVHQVDWNGKDTRGHDVASGVYYYKLNAGEFEATRPLVLSR